MVTSEASADSERPSALSRVTIDMMPVSHADARRIAVEIFSSPGITN